MKFNGYSLLVFFAVIILNKNKASLGTLRKGVSDFYWSSSTLIDQFRQKCAEGIYFKDGSFSKNQIISGLNPYCTRAVKTIK